LQTLGISGSLRRDSHNTKLLRAAARALPPGAELVLFDGVAALPPYDEDADVQPGPPSVEHLRERIAAADGLLIATPEYNASIPGGLKNAIDWASRPFPDNALRGQPVAVIGASTGLFGAVWAQAELRKVLHHAGAQVLDEELPIALADHAFTPDGGLADPDQERRLGELLGALACQVAVPVG
jgi:chromate reductase, NAD(P)H dehydrogenase (quinone)